MSRSSNIAKQGYVKVKSKHVGKWSKRWLILRRESPHGDPVRLLKYRDEIAVVKSQPTVFDLSNVEFVGRMADSDKRQIYIVFADFTTLQFTADSETETEEWLRVIKEETSIDSSESDPNGSREMFEVYLMKSNQLKASGECLIQVSADAIKLLDMDDPSHVQVTWPLSCVRRYSVEHGMLVVEVGRAAETGEGSFVFDGKECGSIYDKIDSSTRRLRISKPTKPSTAASVDASSNTARSRNDADDIEPRYAKPPPPKKVNNYDASSNTAQSRNDADDIEPRYARPPPPKKLNNYDELPSDNMGGPATEHVGEQHWLIRNQVTKGPVPPPPPPLPSAMLNPPAVPSAVKMPSPSAARRAIEQSKDEDLNSALKDAFSRLGIRSSAVVDKIELPTSSTTQ